MDILFENNTKDQIREAADKNAMVLLPVGILEEHGSHLPVNTDNVIAYDIAKQAAEKIKDKIPVMGLPGCVMYAKTTVFDLVLPRIIAGIPVTRKELAHLGNGGFCLGCETCHYPNCGFGKGV